MKNPQIYYYTRTGRSEKLAKKLAAEHSCPLHKITDKENWDGIMGFLRGGAKASKKEYLPITYTPPTLDNDSDIILVFPVWAGGFPPAVNTFLRDLDTFKHQITLIPTSLGTKLKHRDRFKCVIDVVGKDISDIKVDLS